MKISEAKTKQTTTSNGVSDRLYVGLFSTAAAAILGALIWLGFQLYLGDTTNFVSFKYVAYFSLTVGFLGFLLKINIVIAILSNLMKTIMWLGKLW